MLDPIDTDPSGEWVQEVFAVMSSFIDESPSPRGLAYFTDAAALAPAYGNPPTIICGPGDAEQAHRTDESISLSALEASAEAFFEISRRWCGALTPSAASTHAAAPSTAASSSPTSCTPTGIPAGPRSPGTLIAGTPSSVHARQNTRVAGVALGPRRRLAERRRDDQGVEACQHVGQRRAACVPERGAALRLRGRHRVRALEVVAHRL